MQQYVNNNIGSVTLQGPKQSDVTFAPGQGSFDPWYARFLSAGQLTREEVTPPVVPGVFPFEINWNAVWALDSGGWRATALARHIMSSLARIRAVGIQAGGTHSDWLLPMLNRYDYPRLVIVSWGGIFTPGSPSYMAFPDDPTRYAVWLAYVNTMMTGWLPDVVLVDQEYIAAKVTMPVDVRAAVDSAVGTSVPIYYYDGRLHFADVVGDGGMPPYYVQKTLPDRSAGPGLWLASDPVNAAVEWQAYDLTRAGDDLAPLVTARPLNDYPGNRHELPQSYPWLTLLADSDFAHYDGALVDQSKVVDMCQYFKASGCDGFCVFPGPWQLGVGDINSAHHDQMIDILEAGIAAWY